MSVDGEIVIDLGAMIFVCCKVKWQNLKAFRAIENSNQRTNGPVNAHLISWPSKAQNKQNLENIW